MRIFNRTWLVGIFAALICEAGIAQTNGEAHTLSLTSLDAFRQPGANWIVAGDALADPGKALDMRPVAGQGVLVNNFSRNAQMHLYTRDSFADLELELDFMTAKNSSSGVYFCGRYELQLPDSWTRLQVTAADAGGISSRSSPERGTFEGTAPVMNTARAPGLWQRLKVRFRAPRFNAQGQKTVNARFESVHLNGVLVQQETEVTGPTGAAMFADERPAGPLVIRGDHGPLAIRNIRLRNIAAEGPVKPQDRPWWASVKQATVDANARPEFVRTFFRYKDKKLTHAISVGHPSRLHYSYDLRQGALFQAWRGDFLDMTPAWSFRGEEQISIPMGSLVTLSDAPAVAVLPGQQSPWPDSIAFDDMQGKGYVLDRQRSPTFLYSARGLEVKDSIVVMPDGQSLIRTLTVRNPAPDVYCRLAGAPVIESLGGDLYAVDGKSYYLRVEKKYRPLIRKTAAGQELLVRYDSAGPVTYSLIF